MARRVQKKAAAQVVQRQLAAEARWRRLIWTAVASTVALVIAASIGYGLWRAQAAKDYATPAYINPAKDGVALVSAPGRPVVDFYVNYQCAHCRDFENEVAPLVEQWITDRTVQLVYHPVPSSSSANSDDYSTRASSAAGCAADSGKLHEFNKALFAKPLPKTEAEAGNDRLIQVGNEAGLTDATFAQCVQAGTYKGWAHHVADGFIKQGLSETPTVLINGKKVKPESGETWTAALTRAVSVGS